MSKSFFVKYQGAGNDFILIDDRLFSFDLSRVPLLCHRKMGIGADGVILLQNDRFADFRMRIFNQDGSEAESCGNGLRCLLRFIADLGFPQKTYRIATADRVVEAGFLKEEIFVDMGKPRHLRQLILEDTELYSLDTGVPHLVLFVPDVSRIDVLQQGSKFRHHPSFQPRGTNVNFATLQMDGLVRVRTFERGLESESMACGTGAAAVAAIARQKYQLGNPIRISFPGGDLSMYVDEEGHIKMVGPAHKVFEGFAF